MGKRTRIIGVLVGATLFLGALLATILLPDNNWLWVVMMGGFVATLAAMLAIDISDMAIEYENAVEEYHNIKEEIEAQDKECE